MGAGHSHALVLQRWAKQPPEGVRLTVVTDRTELLYSGMIPGLVAGEYERADLVIDAATLASRAGAELTVGKVERVDARNRVLHLVDGRTLAYDVASLDVGSVPAGEPEAGSLAVKAPEELRSALDGMLPRSPSDSSPPDPSPPDVVVIVGGGAAGVELAAAIRARLSATPKVQVDVRLVEAGPRLMGGYRSRVSRRAMEALRARGVDVRVGQTFASPDDSDALVVWAAGSAAPPLLRRSGLPVDAGGFVLVDETLRAVGHTDLFAAGDCASLRGHDLPKAGVHAVRQAPVLFQNLLAISKSLLTGGPSQPGAASQGETPDTVSTSLRRYDPQSDYLTLLNLGDGTALGTKWGLVVEGRWVRWLKDRIDRRFVQRFKGRPGGPAA